MNRLELAISSFFWIFFNKRFAQKVEAFFTAAPPEVEKKKEKPVEVPKKAERSDAVQLVALLQREGRLVDFLEEPIDAYNDAQIGAAVRDVHRDCASVLKRVFDIGPVLEQDEGSKVPVLPGFNPERYKLVGNVTGNPPYQGVLRHHGWKINKCELPKWQGTDDATDIVAPAEVELP